MEDLSIRDVSNNTVPDDIPLRQAVCLFMLLCGILNRRSDKVEDLLQDKEMESTIISLRNGLGGVVFRASEMFKNDIEHKEFFC